jgi:hypothetical protein
MARRIPRDSDPPLVWAEYYLSLGWGLSHFQPGTKGPSDKGWNTPQHWIDTPAKAAKRWAETPAHGMGVIHAASGTVAIDIDAIEPTRRIFHEFGIDIDEMLAPAPRIRGALTGRDKAIFRAPDGTPLMMHKAQWVHPTDKAQSMSLFELRTGPVHDCLPPSTHPDGHRYEWRRAPWELGHSIPPLPELLLAFWRDFPQLRDQIAQLSPWATPPAFPSKPRLIPAEGHNDVIGHFNQAHSVDALLRAHGYVRRGKRYLAPSSSSKIPGVVVLNERAYSHHASDPLNDGFAHDAFDLYTRFEFAGDMGAALRAASALLDLPVYGTVGPRLDFSELVAAATKTNASRAGIPDEPPEFPLELLEVPGLVGELAGYLNRTARYPQPILTLGAAIAGAATLMGRKVCTESNLRTNIYILGVAESGAGKEHARQALRTVFDAAGAFRRVSVEGLASDAALNTALVAVPSSLFLLDEIGRFLAVVSDARASSHQSEIITQLLKIYSAAAGPYCGKVYADADRAQVVQQPNLSIYGTTVPSAFYAALTTSQIEDGFLSRLLVFESPDPDPEPRDVLTEPPSVSLIEQCEWWERAPEQNDPTQGNVDAMLRPSPRIVGPDSAARVQLNRFEREMRVRRQELRKANLPASLYVRTAANAQKLALISACGVDPEHPVITAADANWGCALALHLADRMAWRILAHVAENITERNVKRVAGLIRDAGSAGISKREITRRTQWLRNSERQDVLATLGSSGEAFVRTLPPSKAGGPSTEKFFWHTFAQPVLEQPEVTSIPLTPNGTTP